jgi:hypothetical protein
MTGGQSASLSWCLGPKMRFFTLSDRCSFVDMRHTLRQEDRSVIYNCCWSSPAQSFLLSYPTRLMTIFYCLRFEPPPNWRASSLYYLRPPGTGWRSYTYALGSLFVIYCDLQDDGGGILTCLHRGLTKLPRLPSLYSLDMDYLENTASDSSSIVVCISVATDAWLSAVT